MVAVLRSTIASIWNGKYRGLQIFAVGFLTAAGGALLAVLAGYAGSSFQEEFLNPPLRLLAMCGYGIMILGMATGALGILVSWWSAFGNIDKLLSIFSGRDKA
jgi:hypothetical protein